MPDGPDATGYNWAMPSSHRVEIHRAVALQRIARAWDKRPDLTLGELIAEATYGEPALRSMTDEQLLGLIEKLVLLRS